MTVDQSIKQAVEAEAPTSTGREQPATLSIPISWSSWIYTWTHGHHTHTHTHAGREREGRGGVKEETLGPIISESVYFCPLTAGDRLVHYILMRTVTASLSSALRPSYLLWAQFVFFGFFFSCCCFSNRLWIRITKNGVAGVQTQPGSQNQTTAVWTAGPSFLPSRLNHSHFFFEKGFNDLPEDSATPFLERRITKWSKSWRL